jgi:hypothetical protein
LAAYSRMRYTFSCSTHTSQHAIDGTMRGGLVGNASRAWATAVHAAASRRKPRRTPPQPAPCHRSSRTAAGCSRAVGGTGSRSLAAAGAPRWTARAGS